MTFDPRPVQAELLLPHQLSDALDARSLVYLPLGSIEWHSHHLPVGLDGLTAHGLCVRAAARTGGIVLPTLYYGTGGGHAAYPWTVMTDADTLTVLITRSLTKLVEFGVRTVVLFTGHFADEQLAMITDIADSWPTDSPLTVTALSINGNTAAGIAPDHAGIFETSLLQAMSPELVDLHQLPTLAAAAADDPDGNPVGAHRHAPDHPLYGVFGPDPRDLDPAAADQLLKNMTHWLATTVDITTRHSTVPV